MPLDVINAASQREKRNYRGHPSTLHLWWARRPLAACRAVLFAQLVDDPSSHPDKFKTKQEVLHRRDQLFDIIKDLVNYEEKRDDTVFDRAREEIADSCGGSLPPVYDPFSGGGSIPLEAQRLGLPANGSDLNPVAVMIGKAMLEVLPRFNGRPPVNPSPERNSYVNAEGIAEDVMYYGNWIRDRAFERIGEVYPKVNLPAKYGGGNATAIAWIWARTVPSPDPAFDGASVPISSNFVLCSKPGKETWVEPIVDRGKRRIFFKIREGGTIEEFQNARRGTKVSRGGNFRCLLSGAAITLKYVKAMGVAGKLGDTLLAAVCKGRRGRIFVDPTTEMQQAAKSRKASWKPNLKLSGNTQYIGSGPAYGFNSFGDLFSHRQLLALTTFSDLVLEVREMIEKRLLHLGGG